MSDLFIIGKSKTTLFHCSTQASDSECVDLALKGETCSLEATQVPFRPGTEQAWLGEEALTSFKEKSPQVKAGENLRLPAQGYCLLQCFCRRTRV